MPLRRCDEENGQEPDSSGSGQRVLCREEAVGYKDSQTKDQWAGIEALKTNFDSTEKSAVAEIL